MNDFPNRKLDWLYAIPGFAMAAFFGFVFVTLAVVIVLGLVFRVFGH
jgi:tetrahydromethanopterin S-methyltransferase subunit B